MDEQSQTKRCLVTKTHIGGVTERWHDGCQRYWLDVANVVLEHGIDGLRFKQRLPIESAAVQQHLQNASVVFDRRGETAAARVVRRTAFLRGCRLEVG